MRLDKGDCTSNIWIKAKKCDILFQNRVILLSLFLEIVFTLFAMIPPQKWCFLLVLSLDLIVALLTTHINAAAAA